MYPRKKRIVLHLNAISYRVPMPVTQVVKCCDGYFDAICPRCLGFQPYEYTLFCSNCGQRLSWMFLDDAEELDSVHNSQKQRESKWASITLGSLTKVFVCDNIHLIWVRIAKGGSFMYKNGIKRALDCVIAAPVLAIGAIPMGLVAAAIKLDSPGPVLFKQDRIGKDGKVFQILKFRSMTVGAEHTGSGVYSGKNDARVTRVGKIIRATSIDELPQLINILRGDMSLIGPRPPLTYHPWPIEEYTDEQKRMFEVRPGITGWAQVHGRKDVEWHKRIELNVWYVDHVSFWLDTKIFFMTIFKVLSNADNENIGETVAK